MLSPENTRVNGPILFDKYPGAKKFRQEELKILHGLLNEGESTAVIGPPQSGKTSLVLNCFREVGQYLFTDASIRNVDELKADIDLKLSQDPARTVKYICIDEITDLVNNDPNGIEELMKSHKVVWILISHQLTPILEKLTASKIILTEIPFGDRPQRLK